MTVTEMAPHLVEGFQKRAAARLRPGTERLRPSLHFCVIPSAAAIRALCRWTRWSIRCALLTEARSCEIVLTGVDLTSYGADLTGAPRLGDWSRRSAACAGRAGFGSPRSDSIEVDPDLLDAIANEDRLMPHLHLSLQSGDDMILKRMKRRHSRGRHRLLCAGAAAAAGHRLRCRIIAGFPTETDDMFARSLDLSRTAISPSCMYFHTRRAPGTPAARMPQVAADVIRDRARQLRARGDAALRRRLAAEVGARRQVLIESAIQGPDRAFCAGRDCGGDARHRPNADDSRHDAARLLYEVSVSRSLLRIVWSFAHRAGPGWRGAILMGRRRALPL